MAQIDIQNLTFAYPGSSRPALDDICLRIARGSYACICGRSGCGKTTLVRQLKGVLTPHGATRGQVLFEGTPLAGVDEREQAAAIGFVMQDPDAQIVTDKVWHELAFGLESLGCDQRVMRLRVAEMASYFGIQEWFHKDVRELSGGQKQLLNLASVMAMQPGVLILDEPTSQLDPIAASDFLSTVRKINLELGVTIIITEHRLEDVFATADQVVVMDAGRIVAEGTPKDVARKLYASDDPMTYALPAPVRIFYGVREATVKSHVTQGAAGCACPLTVREGRSWLAEWEKLHPPTETALAEEPLDGLATDSPALQMKEVWFRYERDGVDVLRGVNLEVPPATTFAIVGGNGAGKSTTLKCACGVLGPYHGSVRVFGKKLKNYKGDELHRGTVAMLPQDPLNLFVRKTVIEDLSEMLEGQGLSAAERETRIERVVALCDIAGLLESHPFDLSGGELQRAALAKVLLANPRLLLLDEPTKGIDSFFKRELARILDELKTNGVTIVIVSHDIEFCARFADSVSMFFDGSIVTTNTPRRFFSQNSFYTTAANRMSRSVFANAVTDEDVIELCLT